MPAKRFTLDGDTRALFDFDEEELRPYFPVERVTEASREAFLQFVHPDSIRKGLIAMLVGTVALMTFIIATLLRAPEPRVSIVRPGHEPGYSESRRARVCSARAASSSSAG